MTRSATVSILTPTYNRLHDLERLFRTIGEQDLSEVSLEWIVVDDGSSDGTWPWLSEVSRDAAFRISCQRQQNAGRASALTSALHMATGEFCMLMDSDDWIEPGGVRCLLDTWWSIPEARRPSFAGVVGQCVDARGRLIGTNVSQDYVDSDFVSMREGLGLRGDKKELIRTDLLRERFFPLWPDERRVATSTIWIALARDYAVRVTSRVVAGKDYRPDGLSANIRRVRMNSPNASQYRYQLYLESEIGIRWSSICRAAANFTRYSLHARSPIRMNVGGGRERIATLLTAPVGVALYVWDHVLHRWSHRFGGPTR